MGYVVSLVGYLPPPRYDGVAWVSARVEEAPAPDGPWTSIDTLVLLPVDVDPSVPAVRNLTTSSATLPAGWYRVTFLDAGTGESEPSPAERSSTSEPDLPPSPDAVRNGSPLLRKKFPVPPTNPSQIGDLRTVVYQATALVQAITWRLIDPTLGCPAPEGYTCDLVPPSLVPVAFEAITRMAERIYVTTEADFAEQMATGRRLRGFTAGPYSENYFAPGEFARRGAQQGRPAVDPDDALDAALWALMSEDARDYFVWRATGQAPPDGQAIAFDYRRQTRGYSAGSRGYPLVGGAGGPDGF